MEASILLANERVGTVTDENGNFSVKVKSFPVTVLVDYLGYLHQEIKVNQLTEPLAVLLHENSNLLDEVVITALGITREKKSLGYATQTSRAKTSTATHRQTS